MGKVRILLSLVMDEREEIRYCDEACRKVREARSVAEVCKGRGKSKNSPISRSQNY